MGEDDERGDSIFRTSMVIPAAGEEPLAAVTATSPQDIYRVLYRHGFAITSACSVSKFITYARPVFP